MSQQVRRKKTPFGPGNTGIRHKKRTRYEGPEAIVTEATEVVEKKGDSSKKRVLLFLFSTLIAVFGTVLYFLASTKSIWELIPQLAYLISVLAIWVVLTIRLFPNIY